MLHMYKKICITFIHRYVHNVQNIWHTDKKRRGIGLPLRVEKGERMEIHILLIVNWCVTADRRPSRKTPTTANLHHKEKSTSKCRRGIKTLPLIKAGADIQYSRWRAAIIARSASVWERRRQVCCRWEIHLCLIWQIKLLQILHQN